MGQNDRRMDPLWSERMKIALYSLFYVALIGSLTKAETLSIENDSLKVSYDTALQRFSIQERATGKAVVSDGRLLDRVISGARVMRARDAIFAKGRQIRVSYADGAVSRLELYPSLPFLLVKTEVHSSAASEADLDRTVPVQFAINLDRPVNDLRTLGTAGLTTADKNPGSYLFLTLADPETRRGLVAGWLTEDRGSGVLFSSANTGRVTFSARI